MTRPILRSLLTFSLLAPLLAQAQAKPFPDNPLQTGNERPAANLWLILDDSGSMEYDYIPDGLTNSTFVRRNVDKNPLAYDTKRDYEPWKKWDGSLMTGGTSYNATYADSSLSSGNTSNLWNSTQTFYVRKDGRALSTSTTDYDNYWQIQIFLEEQSCGRRCTETVEVYERCERSSGSNFTRNCTRGDAAAIATNGRTMAQELQNYATWYSWHRTRMKTAKAGISQTFSQLGPSVRVGYTSIWNRNRYEIPVGNGDGGVFKGTAKQTFFNRFVAAEGSGSTNLHGALTQAGEYFTRSASNGPWGPEAGSDQYSCRQSFAILTSDGYWNNSSSYSPTAGNQDGANGSTITNSKGWSYRYTPSRPFSDTYSDTLADVAMKYWKNDLRTDLENNVPRSESNPAFWQHMVTFGVSIGLKGSLDPNTDYPSLVNGSKSWPNPWRTSSNNYDSWNNESNRRIDDLWHASVNGHGAFFAATSPDEFADALNSILNNVQKILASGSNVSTSSTSLQTDTRIFHASYYSGIWTGDMAAYDISSAGVSSEPNWLASNGIPAHGSRKALTWNGSAGVTFPTTAQATAARNGFLAMNPAETAVTTTQIGNYLKGDASLEKRNLGALRNRESKMGDVVNSSPVYSADTDTLFIGANDGFLHAVNATNGAERFVYAPAGINYSDLGSLASPDYTHKYFVDGQIAVSTRKQTPGKNLLISGLGRGGKGVFALNVTNPAAFGAGQILWDQTAGVDNDMGYVMGEPLLAKGNDGKFLAIIPNGVGSTNNCSALFVYELETGTLLRKITTGACANTAAGQVNGLSSPRGWDSDGDGTVDEVYAGDLLGNLWKFDLTATVPSQWKVAFSGQPLFRAVSQTGTPQPISGGLSLGYELYGSRRWVLFGTGRYLATGDVLNTDEQTVYGIIDGTTRVSNRSDLVERGIEVVSSGGQVLRGFETWQPLPNGKRGWALDLGDPYEGERVIERGYLAGRIFVFPTVIPTSSNACEASGRGFLNAIDAFTGTSTSVDSANHAYFDIGNDGNPNNDWIGQDGQTTGGSTAGALPVGSVETNIGMVTKPVLVGDQLVYGGSSGGKESRKVNIPPASAKRLSWREVPAL